MCSGWFAAPRATRGENAWANTERTPPPPPLLPRPLPMHICGFVDLCLRPRTPQPCPQILCRRAFRLPASAHCPPRGTPEGCQVGSAGCIRGLEMRDRHGRYHTRRIRAMRRGKRWVRGDAGWEEGTTARSVKIRGSEKDGVGSGLAEEGDHEEDDGEVPDADERPEDAELRQERRQSRRWHLRGAKSRGEGGIRAQQYGRNRHQNECIFLHMDSRYRKRMQEGQTAEPFPRFSIPIFLDAAKNNNPRPHISNASARRRCVTGGMKTPHKNRKHWGGDDTQYSNIGPGVAWGLLPIGGPPGNPSGGYASGFDPLRR